MSGPDGPEQRTAAHEERLNEEFDELCYAEDEADTDTGEDFE